MRRFVLCMGVVVCLLVAGAVAEAQAPVDFSNATTTVLPDGNVRINNVRVNLPPDVVGTFFATFAFTLEIPGYRLVDFGPWIGSEGGGPFDTYFSLAVVENGHNHSGSNLLFLDFNGDTPSGNTVLSKRVPANSIRLDGSMADWDATMLSTIPGRPMNNYPLSEFFDAINTEITVGSAYDEENFYLLVSWLDANNDRSDRRNEWQFDGASWSQMTHARVAAGTRQANVVNRDDPLSGNESEDRVLIFFPIVDTENNFTGGGIGCGAYCHANLARSGNPATTNIADGVSVMATNVADDHGDEWHWKAARSAPMGSADDRKVSFAEGTADGRGSDAGRGTDGSNSNQAGDGPSFMPIGGGSARVLYDAAKQPLDQSLFRAGDFLPFAVSRAPQGSRGDVRTADSFDPATGRWVVEFQRKLFTGNADDHQFTEGADASPPISPAVSFGAAANGRPLYAEKCAACHGASGEGLFSGDAWSVPRVQRASSPLILRAIRYVPAMSRIELAAQQAEDIAAFLQTQIIAQP